MLTPRFKQGVARCVSLLIVFFAFALLFCCPLASAADSPAPWSISLESVLNLMDQRAAQFHSLEASLVWDEYTKVIDQTDTQKGKIYFRRSGNEIQMAADINDPAADAKYVLFSGGKVQLAHGNQIDVYSTEKNQEMVETFLLLGFGGGGHSLLKSFDVKYLGTETLPSGTMTAKLELIPKSVKISNNVDRILLWIDADGISVQQQFFTGSDYKLQKYSDIKLNQKLPEGVFTLKAFSKAKTITH